MSARGINLKSVCGVADGPRAVVCMVVVDDVAGARTALQESRMTFEESEVLSELMDDEPGQVADLAAKLSNAGVNLNSLYILARETPLIEVGFTVDDAKKAKKALEK